MIQRYPKNNLVDGFKNVFEPCHKFGAALANEASRSALKALLAISDRLDPSLFSREENKICKSA